MELLTDDFRKFAIQRGVVKDAIVSTVFDKDRCVKSGDVSLHLEDHNMVIGVSSDVGYLCCWRGDLTIMIYRYEDKCKVKFYDKTSTVRSFFIGTSGMPSVFTMLMDYYELENIIRFNSLRYKTMRKFSFGL